MSEEDNTKQNSLDNQADNLDDTPLNVSNQEEQLDTIAPPMVVITDDNNNNQELDQNDIEIKEDETIMSPSTIISSDSNSSSSSSNDSDSNSQKDSLPALDETHFQGPIIDYYKNKNILMTGATGFIGKAILWKLIQSLRQHLGQVYILIRSGSNKRSKIGRPAERLKNEIFSNKVREREVSFNMHHFSFIFDRLLYY